MIITMHAFIAAADLDVEEAIQKGFEFGDCRALERRLSIFVYHYFAIHELHVGCKFCVWLSPCFSKLSISVFLCCGKVTVLVQKAIHLVTTVAEFQNCLLPMGEHSAGGAFLQRKLLYSNWRTNIW